MIRYLAEQKQLSTIEEYCVDIASLEVGSGKGIKHRCSGMSKWRGSPGKVSVEIPQCPIGSNFSVVYFLSFSIKKIGQNRLLIS